MTKVAEHHDTLKRVSVCPEEARTIIGVSRNTMYRMLANGRLRSVRVGRKILIPLSAIDELMNGMS